MSCDVAVSTRHIRNRSEALVIGSMRGAGGGSGLLEVQATTKVSATKSLAAINSLVRRYPTR